jgi:hypothetical protein
MSALQATVRVPSSSRLTTNGGSAMYKWLLVDTALLLIPIRRSLMALLSIVTVNDMMVRHDVRLGIRVRKLCVATSQAYFYPSLGNKY